MSERLNVILILSDDQGSVDLGCYGSDDLETPNLDRLAASGVRFTNFYANAPICMPSRVSLLTGRDYPRGLLPGNGLKPDEITAAELFRRAGYRTALFGKWHLGSTPEMSPNAQGFDEFFGHRTGTLDAYSHFFYVEGVNRHVLERNGEPVQRPGEYLPDLLVDEATSFIDRAGDDPYFLYLPFAIPHYPVQPRREHRELYESKGIDDKRRVLYGAYLTTLDECVGRVLAAVEANGQSDRTLVIFLSDHGHSTEPRAFGGGGSAGPYSGHKETLWEGGIRVPCIASCPGRIPAGQVRHQPAIAMDWLPTMAEFCDVPLPDDRPIDGRSLAGVLASDEAPPPHEQLHWVHYDGSFAVREGRWKLHSNPEENWLSDLATDPGERTNVVEEQTDRMRSLVRSHNRWLKNVAAQSGLVNRRTRPAPDHSP
ncbi:MAG TPA: sulfatase-like hydrolase/transferase [Candidatus Latescibacteria bacterium]|nr:sulfatase-like hydrolase/transferase [Candidatus Latescibacterota bacterium]